MLIITDKKIDWQEKEAEIININEKIINPCTGCFNCWIKTPGSCVIKDDQISIYTRLATVKELIFVCKIKYGSYDVAFKAMLERCLPLQQAFLRIHKGQIAHMQRGVESKDALIIGYGVEQEEEKEIFKRLVERNSTNLAFYKYEVIFAKEPEVEEILQREVSKRWGK